jgi:Ca-activated chloride channel family protein
MLFALFLLIPAAFMSFFHYRKHRAVLGFLSGDSMAANIRFRYLLSAGAFQLFLACMIIALAQPRGGSRPVSETRRGVDVVFAIDLSRSMDVRDLSADGPSRLGRAAGLVTELVNHPRIAGRSSAGGASGIRFGVAIGKGQGALALPLTEDVEAINSFMASLSGSVITGRGTNLESLVGAAAAAFQDAFPSRRRIILLSDGEALEGTLDGAADRAAAADITLIAVGLGSMEGGVVPLGNETLLGEDGRPVVSSMRTDAMRDAAERTGGFYMDGNRSNAAVLLAERLAALASGGSLSPAKGFRRETRSLAHIFIIAALILMGISGIAEKGTRKNG